MPDDKNRLPEGTDRIIGGASEPGISNSGTMDVGSAGGTSGSGSPGRGTGGTGGGGGGNAGGDEGEVLIVTEVTAVAIDDDNSGGTTGSTGSRGSGAASRSGGSGTTASGGSTGSGSKSSGGGSSRTGAVTDKIRSGTEKLSGQAADKARGLVGQGLERSADALSNVGRLVSDTAEGLDERLGPEYGDYARRAASTIDGVADSLANKDPDELIDDTRNFVRKSPGVALAGAAIVGFALARLIKTGLARGDDDRPDTAGRTGTTGGTGTTTASGGTGGTGTTTGSGGKGGTGTTSGSGGTGGTGRGSRGPRES